MNVTIDGNTTIVSEINLGAGDVIRFEVCRENESRIFRISIGPDVVSSQYPPGNTNVTACVGGCDVVISDNGISPSVLILTPGTKITFLNSLSTVPIDDVVLNQVSDVNNCQSVVGLSYPLIAVNQSFTFEVPRRYQSSDIFFTVSPFCGLSPVWNLELIIRSFNSKVLTLAFLNVA